MKADYSAPICKPDGIIAIQFETDNYDLYSFVKRACQDAVDIANTYNNPELGRIMGLRWDNGGDADGKRTDV